jgi:GNAT superfamily N-acetyltransferase
MTDPAPSADPAATADPATPAACAPTVASWPQAEVPAAVRRQIALLERAAWPDAVSAKLSHDEALRPVCLALLDGEAVVAALAVLSEDLVHAGERYEASGLSAVVTDPGRRRRGYGSRLVGAALALMTESGTDVGLLTCDRELETFYARAGWTALRGAVLVGGVPADPLPSDGLGKTVMAAFLSERARRNAAAFRRARIALYPGTIDRLW